MRLIATLASIIFISTGITNGETVTISAAISLKEALGEIAKDYEATTHDHVVLNFDASGKLAAQIKQGAPVDGFISADDAQMDQLEKTKLIVPGSRRAVVDNTLVLIVPANEKNAPKDFADLANDHGKKIAVGEPRSVPAGRYAQQTFVSLKLEKAVKPHLVFGESVRQVLIYVEQDEVCAGVVYGTDAKLAGDKVKVVATADAAWHDRIEYPAAVVTASTHADATKKFLDFLTTDPAKKIFTDKGFTPPAKPSPATAPTRATNVQ